MYNKGQEAGQCNKELQRVSAGCNVKDALGTMHCGGAMWRVRNRFNALWSELQGSATGKGARCSLHFAWGGKAVQQVLSAGQ
eukprot:scaffold13954_cov22-Tisochrysis_lutea.AAC.3